jgi:hypothetical protein
MTYTLVFGFSSSRDYARAVRLASAVPGYAAEGAGHDIRHCVPVDASAARLLDELLALVSAWRSSTLLADGVAVGRPGALRTVLACQRQHARSGLGVLHCWGLPAVERGRVPCRLLERVLPWTLAGEYATRGSCRDCSLRTRVSCCWTPARPATPVRWYATRSPAAAGRAT